MYCIYLQTIKFSNTQTNTLNNILLHINIIHIFFTYVTKYTGIKTAYI